MRSNPAIEANHARMLLGAVRDLALDQLKEADLAEERRAKLDAAVAWAHDQNWLIGYPGMGQKLADKAEDLLKELRAS
jgi:hypothetical protein